jgi:phospholipid/cholesterol/gamma-HCH transport system substrate-binding protein
MRMRPLTNADPVKAALIGFAVFALLLVLAFNLNPLPVIGAGPEYKADFTDTAGLQNGEEVRVAGIKVGQVTGIDLVGAHVVVSFRIKGQRLGRATRASIEIKTLLGQHYLSVTPDGPGALPAGSEIPLERTSTPVQIVPTAQRLVHNIDAIDTTRLAAAFDTLSDALGATAPQVRATLDGLSALSHTIASRDEQIRQLFSKAHSVTGVVSSRDAQIAQLIVASNQVLDVLHRRKDTIHDLLVGTRDLSNQVSGLVHDNEAQLHPALEKLYEVVQVLKRNDDNLDKILTRLPPYLRLFTNVGGTGPWFDTDITLPRAFAICSSGGGGQFAALLNPILSQANQAVNGSSAPCLPLGPAANAAPATASAPAASGGHR